MAGKLRNHGVVYFGESGPRANPVKAVHEPPVHQNGNPLELAVKRMVNLEIPKRDEPVYRAASRLLRPEVWQ